MTLIYKFFRREKNMFRNTSTKYVLKKIKPYKFTFLLLLLGTVLTSLISEVYPYIFGKIVDEVFYGRRISGLVNLVICYFAIFVFNQLIYYVVNISWAKLNTTFVFDVRRDMFNKVLKYKGSRLTKLNTGDILNRMSEDSTQMFNYVYWNIFYTITDSLCIILALIFVGFISLKMMFVIIVMTPIIVYLSRYFARIVREKQTVIREDKGKLNAWIYEMLRGMQEIRFIGASHNVLNGYIRKSINLERKGVQKDIVEIKATRISDLIKTVGTIVVYGVAAFCICRDEATLGDFVAFAAYFDLCVKSFDDLNFVILGFGSNAVGIKRVMEIINNDSEMDYKVEDGVDFSSSDIVIKDVSFAYEGGNQILNHIDLSIKTGEKIAIVGRSGSGKTTIASLLVRIFETNEGNICIGNKKIQEYDLKKLRNFIGIVHQESIFFEGSIRYNISFSEDKENEGEIWEALRKASIYDFVKNLPNGLDTKIVPENNTFSGGEKQRLAIARILYKKPSIIVFDESTAFLDRNSEEEIKTTWNSLDENITIIVIAHKASTIEDFERIVVLEHGKIIGDGNHENLKQSCSEYRLLFSE